ncbi:MAG: FecR domain-containing protein, partial [Flavitalea sp.]
MEGRDKFNELLLSYLLNELDSEDEALISEWLNSDQQNKLYLEELKKTLNLVRLGQALGKVNVDAEWNRFEQVKQGKEQKPVLINEAERFGDDVIKELGLKRKTSIYRTIAVTAVAACIVLAIGLGWSLFNKEKPVRQTVTRIVKEKAEVNTPFIRNLVNNTGKSKRYELEDGSIVLLSPKSQLSFQEPFESNKRDIQLKGKADFSVAKNNLKPF